MVDVLTIFWSYTAAIIGGICSGIGSYLGKKLIHKYHKRLKKI